MLPPSHIVERLKSVNPELRLRWNGGLCRWELWRGDPIFRGSSYLVKLWEYEEDHSYKPLDNRLFRWLYEADLTRKFGGRDARVVARLLQAEIAESNEKSDVANDKKLKDNYGPAREEMEYAIRRDLSVGSPVPRVTRKKHMRARKHSRISYLEV